MAKVAIITSYFPFGTPEQFFEPEILAWADSGHDVVVLPMRSTGPARPVPHRIEVDTSLAVLDTSKRRGSARRLIRSLTSRSVLRELARCVRLDRRGLRRIAEIVSTEAQARDMASRISQSARKHGGFDIVYAYWHGVGAYGATIARDKGAPIGRVVARAHRVDLYENVRPTGHHPRKRTYAPKLDIHAAISDEGARYLERTYGLDPASVVVARLGCDVDGSRTSPTSPGELHVLSTSFVTPVKRVDKIFEALELAASELDSTQVRWTHLGAGPDFEDLKSRVARSTARNLTIDLLGQVAHEEVLSFLRSRSIDLFVNFSRSEGVPVSIMEAMSVGIPAIAPAVGGVSELVDEHHGALLASDPTVAELAAQLVAHRDVCKSQRLRDAVHARVAERFDATKNFTLFIERVTAP